MSGSNVAACDGKGNAWAVREESRLIRQACWAVGFAGHAMSCWNDGVKTWSTARRQGQLPINGVLVAMMGTYRTLARSCPLLVTSAS